ncbi:MAG: MarR family transcriptional regulator [Spirochaetales bacterium]|nr:MarR family transcriptional regulator [Spirochaetales bacterium]
MTPDSIISLISEINHKAKKQIVRELKKNDVEGISASHGDILANLYSRGPMSITKLAGFISKEKNTTTVLIDKLERNGYLTRTLCDEDKRKTIIKLTEKGLSLNPVFRKISRQLIDTTFMNFSEEEKEQVMRLLLRIKQNL